MQSDKWISSGGQWFRLGDSGAMVTSTWLSQGGSWYYLYADGSMATGWAQLGGSWYYFGTNGIMATNKWVGDYYLQDDGSMATGWAKAGGTWYRFSGSGRWASVYSGTYTCPSWAPIKGNKESMIYHQPWNQAYGRTKAEECFAYPSDAEAAGYRAAKR